MTPVSCSAHQGISRSAAERRLAFLSDGLRPEYPPRFLHAVALVPHQAAFGEHARPLAYWQIPQQSSNHVFGMAESVHRGGIDPVDSQLEGATHRGERVGIVLRAPPERPAAAADRPRAEADGRDVESARAEGTGWQRHTDNSR